MLLTAILLHLAANPSRRPASFAETVFPQPAS
jgi:hypothetical protein